MNFVLQSLLCLSKKTFVKFFKLQITENDGTFNYEQTQTRPDINLNNVSLTIGFLSHWNEWYDKDHNIKAVKVDHRSIVVANNSQRLKPSKRKQTKDLQKWLTHQRSSSASKSHQKTTSKDHWGFAKMIDTGLVVVLTITITMLLSVLILLFYDFEDWCPQVGPPLETAPYPSSSPSKLNVSTAIFLVNLSSHFKTSPLINDIEMFHKQVYTALFNHSVSIAYNQNNLNMTSKTWDVGMLNKHCLYVRWYKMQNHLFNNMKYMGQLGNMHICF